LEWTTSEDSTAKTDNLIPRSPVRAITPALSP
jgi:hypothetical protein